MRKLSIKSLVAMLAAFAALQTGLAAANDDGNNRRHSYHSGMLSERLHRQLNLTPDLETQWQQLKEQQAAMHKEMRASHHNSRAVVDAEMAKPQPDLAAINKAMDADHEARYTAQKNLREKMLAFYSALKPESQTIVIKTL